MSRARRERRARRRHRARLAQAAGKSREPMKLSGAIERIIEPYVDEGLSIRAHRNLVALCAAAWNLSVIEYRANRDPSAEGDALERARADVERLGATVAVKELKRRKTLLFPDDRRYVLSTDLRPLRDGGRYLHVTSTVLEEPNEEQNSEPPPPARPR